MTLRTAFALAALAASFGVELWQTSAVSPSRTVKGRDFALIIATDDYDDPYWEDLRNPLFDARTIKTDLEQIYGFQVELVANARLTDIQRKLREYVQQKNFADNDQLLVFFAGHGLFDPGLDLGHIVAKDSRAPKNDDTLSTYFSFGELYRYVQRIPVKHLFVVLDVCHGGTFGDVMRGSDPEYRPASAAQRISTAMQRPSRKFLTSGGNEYVPDGRPGSHSPFAFRFIEALRSVGEDGIVSALQIIQRVQMVQPNRPVWGDLAGSSPGSDFLFVKRGVVATPSNPAPAPPASRAVPVRPTVFELPSVFESLRTGAALSRDLELQQDVYYFFQATCFSSRCNLRLLDAGGKEVAFEVAFDVATDSQGPNSIPSIRFTPAIAARYSLKLEMVQCRTPGQPCGVGVSGAGWPAGPDHSIRLRLSSAIAAALKEASLKDGSFISETHEGSLPVNGVREFRIDALAGDNYRLVVVCDRYCGGVNIQVKDSAGRDIAARRQRLALGSESLVCGRCKSQLHRAIDDDILRRRAVPLRSRHHQAPALTSTLPSPLP